MDKTILNDNGESSRASVSTAEPSEDLPAAMKDVWSRSGSKYRIRAIVLLAVNVLLFAGMGSFAFWLRSGVRFAPIQEGYRDQFKQAFLSVPLTGRSGVSLGSFLLEPISVQDVPMQIPILGLLMAALISIPVLVSILYRFWSSLPFIAVVGFLAVMPWLAITLLVSCVIASVRPFRTRFRFMSALLGLVPAVVYLILAWPGTAEAVVGRIDPVDRMKFVAPWVLAIVAATFVFAIVLAIARVVDYRPGAIAPLLAVMFGLPVALFEFRVGRDELYYRLLESLHDAYFEDVDASVDLEEQAVMDNWWRVPLTARPPVRAVRETVEMQWQLVLVEPPGGIVPARSDLARHQAELMERCDRFLHYFPQSRYTPNALFIKARAMDMRIDAAEFRRTKWIRFYDNFPSGASRTTWRMILENRPKTVLGMVALSRLAQLDAREGDVERAISRLSRLLAQFDVPADPPKADSPLANRTVHRRRTRERPFKGVLTRDSPEASLEVARERTLLEAYCLYDLLAANRDPLYGYEPMSGARHQGGSFSFGLLDLDPRHDRYVENLQALKVQYPNCQLEDNIELEIAKTMWSGGSVRSDGFPTGEKALSDRITRFEQCLEKYPHRDSAPEVLFRLGVAYKEKNQVDKSEGVFRRLIREYPDSIWTRHAARYAMPSRVLSRRAGTRIRAGYPPSADLLRWDHD